MTQEEYHLQNRVVELEAQLAARDAALEAAIAEMKSFDQTTVDVKHALPEGKPRHVLHGQAVGLECAIEILRRHFAAPAEQPASEPTLREELEALLVRWAQQTGYLTVGSLGQQHVADVVRLLAKHPKE